MTSKYLEAAQIGPIHVRNRIIMGSMHTGLEEHKTLDELAEFYRIRAKGEVGLIITGGIGPDPIGAVVAGGATMMNAQDAQKHKVVTDAVHSEGGKIAMQILHAGRYAFNPKLVSASAVKAPISPIAPRALEASEIPQIIESFANSAFWAQQAGYDGVEIMGSEGYLINQFLAKRTNRRDDEWGGSLENRMRFAIEIVRETRKKVGADFGIIFRISLLELVEDGQTWDDVVALAKALEASGVDCLNSGFGWHEARIPTIAASVPPMPFLDLTARLKKEVSIPVVAANRFFEPEQIEAAIDEGKADFVAMARPFLADADFVKKAREGGLIMPCIACNQACLDNIFSMKSASCLVNPRAARETKMPIIPTKEPKSIAIVGAGPAGMSAAIVLSERGHKVTIFEANDALGGQLRYAAEIPGKEDFKRLLKYFETAMQLFQIQIHHKKATEDDLKGFDEVIIATGVRPRIPEIEGVTSARPYDDVILNGSTAKSVAILGSGPIGFDVATFLIEDAKTLEEWRHEWGIVDPAEAAGGLGKPAFEKTQKQITMLQRSSSKFGKSLGKTTGWIHRAKLQAAGVEMIGSASYEAISKDGISVSQPDAEQFIAAEEVILCAGQEAQRELYDQLVASGMSPHIIGGAKDAKGIDAVRAIAEAFALALNL